MANHTVITSENIKAIMDAAGKVQTVKQARRMLHYLDNALIGDFDAGVDVGYTMCCLRHKIVQLEAREADKRRNS